jgi:hypothetical protein
MGWRIDHDRPAVEHGAAASGDALIARSHAPTELLK